MKRLLLIALVIGVVFCSCSLEGDNVVLNKDKQIANECFERILNAIYLKDVQGITALFSQESIQRSESFDISAKALFDYFVGDVVSYNKDGGALFVEKAREGNGAFYAMESSYIVETVDGQYQFAIRYILKDTQDPQNVGVQSLYVLSVQEDVSYPYWGDGKYVPGIHIGITNTVDG